MREHFEKGTDLPNRTLLMYQWLGNCDVMMDRTGRILSPPLICRVQHSIWKAKKGMENLKVYGTPDWLKHENKLPYNEAMKALSAFGGMGLHSSSRRAFLQMPHLETRIKFSSEAGKSMAEALKKWDERKKVRFDFETNPYPFSDMFSGMFSAHRDLDLTMFYSAGIPVKKEPEKRYSRLLPEKAQSLIGKLVVKDDTVPNYYTWLTRKRLPSGFVVDVMFKPLPPTP